MKSIRGFTLLEVLVALGVIAIALAAAVRALGQAADIAGGLADRTLARWVAEDHVALLRAQKLLPAVGTREGETGEADHRYGWTEIANDPPDSPFRRIEVHVHAAGDTPDLALLTVYLLKPVQ
jgi:general secretion pathway protein I